MHGDVDINKSNAQKHKLLNESGAPISKRYKTNKSASLTLCSLFSASPTLFIAAVFSLVLSTSCLVLATLPLVRSLSPSSLLMCDRYEQWSQRTKQHIPQIGEVEGRAPQRERFNKFKKKSTRPLSTDRMEGAMEKRSRECVEREREREREREGEIVYDPFQCRPRRLLRRRLTPSRS